MCGLFGMLDQRSLPLDECMAGIQTLRHRGPDGLGVMVATANPGKARFWRDPTASSVVAESPEQPELFLAHRRLSIVDLSDAAYQPMTNEDRSVWVVFNGEIYNHAELRERLIAAGHSFQTHHSDTETLVHGYEEWGEELPSFLRGMFAFAVVDLRKRVGLLVRDRLGQKPLYVSQSGSRIAFASELKALGAARLLDRCIDPRGLDDYLRFGYVPAPRTIYANVTKLAAGELLSFDFDDRRANERRIYWRRATPEVPTSRARFDEVLAEAVQTRLMSDVPLGLFVSGGLDSATVARAASRASESGLAAFCIAFSDDRYDESVYARQAARHFGLKLEVEIVEPRTMMELLPDLAKIFDEPFSDSSALPTLVLSRMTRKQVTVALSGDGGDELLAGYTRYAINSRLERFSPLWSGRLRGAAFRTVRALWPDHIRGFGLAQLLGRDAEGRYERMLSDPDLAERSRARPVSDIYDFRSVWGRQRGGVIDRMTGVDTELYLPEDLMVKVDRTAMACSLEVRAPLLDHRLVDAAAGLTLAQKFNGRLGKLPFRETLTHDLGDEFVDRPKKGFSVPLGSWFRGPLRTMVRERLLDSPLLSDLFPRTFLQSILDAHTHGSRDQSVRLWKLLMLEQWSERYGGSL
jgi:asparagine synthase (glutamine-hydrolysing)